MSSKTLKSLFCERFECPASAYEEQALRKLLYLHARGVGWLLRVFNPNFFAEDFQFISRLGEASDLQEAHAEAGRFHDIHRRRASFLRNGLKLRVSGRKGVKLACDLFAEAHAASVKVEQAGS